MRRRRASAWIVTGAAALIAALYFVARPLVALGTAYKAKTLCSEIFVAHRSSIDATRSLDIDDLRALRLIHADVDPSAATVTARRFPFTERRARYHASVGCTLEPRATGSVTSAASAPPRPASDGADPHLDTIATLPPNVRSALDAVLDDAFSEPDSTHARRTRAIVILQHGKLVAERYAPGVREDTPLPGWSMAKSVLNALVGIAVREGKLTVNRPTNLRAWSAPGDRRSRISVDDLLRMSTGLEFDEAPGSPSSDLLRMLFEKGDMAAFAASAKLVADPGTTWKYSTGTAMILSRVLREALGDEVYRGFPRNALFDRIGMPRAVMEMDASGTFVASSYTYATAREWARFGQLFLQDGVWMNQRLLPDGWVAYTRTPAPAAPKAVYGALFWLSVPREYQGGNAVLPPDAFHAAGHEAQFVTIVPSADVVIVRLGRTRHPSAWAHDRFVAATLAALRR